MDVFDPSLGMLVIKSVYFFVLFYVVGWALHSRRSIFRFPELQIVSFQVVGAAALYLVGFLLTSFFIRGRWLIVVPFLIIAVRLLVDRLRGGSWTLPPLPRARTLATYSLLSVVVAAIFLVPFVSKKTSGFYAYGGGDQSSYLRISEALVDRTQNEIMPASQDPRDYWVLAPNWSALQLISYIRLGNSLTYANQVVALPFMALAPGATEESYSSGILVILVLLAWTVTALVSALLASTSRSVAGLTFVAAALSSGGMSLALKHAIPSLFSWVLSLFVVWIFTEKMRTRASQFSPLMLGVLFASAGLVYLPCLVLLFLPLCFLSWHLWQQDKKGFLKVFALTLCTVIVLCNFEITRPIRLMIQNSNGALLNYGVNWKQLVLAVSGALDFETLLSHWATVGWGYYLLATGVFLSAALAIRTMDVRGRLTSLLLVVPMLALCAHYLRIVGHYHAIRISDFASVLVMSLSGAGVAYAFLSASAHPSKLKKIVIKATSVALVVGMIVGAWDNKRIIFADVMSPDYPRASFKTSNDLKLTRYLEKVAQEGRQATGHEPIFFDMFWGPVNFANNEIVYRKVSYQESIEYDYTSLLFDQLTESNLRHGAFVYPEHYPPDILTIAKDFMSPPHWHAFGRKIWHAGFGNGAALVGTGWYPATRGFRQMRGDLESAVAIWSETPKQIEVSMAMTALQLAELKTVLAVRYGDADRSEPAELRYAFESGAPVPKAIEQKLRVNELRFTDFPDFGSPTPKEFTFVINLKKGINVVHLIPRLSSGARAGRAMEFSSESRYFKAQSQIGTLLIRKIEIKNSTRACPLTSPIVAVDRCT